MSENNEDNRQMTVIAAEIERQKIELQITNDQLKMKLKVHQRNTLMSDKKAILYSIKVLESLLPKEEESLKDMVEAGVQYAWDHTQFLPQDAANKIFNETFKTT